MVGRAKQRYVNKKNLILEEKKFLNKQTCWRSEGEGDEGAEAYSGKGGGASDHSLYFPLLKP